MIPDFAGCKTQMYNARRGNFPALPKTKEEVNRKEIWTETTNGRRIVLHQDQEMIILSTDNSLQILATTGTQLMDGTFKAAPKIPTCRRKKGTRTDCEQAQTWSSTSPAGQSTRN